MQQGTLKSLSLFYYTTFLYILGMQKSEKLKKQEKNQNKI
jgi:hypothetical protein